MKTVLDVLKAARELLSDESKWTQGDLVRAADGRYLDDVHSPEAACFCLVGGIDRSLPPIPRRKEDSIDVLDAWHDLRSRSLKTVSRAIRSLTDSVYNEPSIPRFNDDPGTTHEDILKVLDEAIKDAGGQEQQGEAGS